MVNFKTALLQKLQENLYNNFGAENFDTERYGTYKNRTLSRLEAFKNTLKKSIGYKAAERSGEIAERFSQYYPALEGLYSRLDEDSRQLLLCILAYRLLGYRKVKLPTNNAAYTNAIGLAKAAKTGTETHDPGFMHLVLNLYDLRALGYPVKLFFSDVGIAIDFILEQYAFKKDGKAITEARNGETVLDVGGCWGDTALYFGAKVGENGKVYSFEFIPGNIGLFHKNIGLNPAMKDRIVLIDRPVSDRSHTPLYYRDNGPGSKINRAPFEGQTGETTSISIDDFVETANLQSVDFIKMDIEGAELPALRGAVNTIKRFRPKLAIAIYHSMEDFVQIPQWILGLDLGYTLHLRHYTIHTEETVIFATPEGA